MAWVAIVAAAGSGSRLGRGEPKALAPLGGRPLLLRTLEALRTQGFSRVVVAAPPDRLAEIRALLSAGEEAIAGGGSRAESVRLGFDALSPKEGDVVCIHDAARPLVTAEEIARVMRAAESGGAAIAAIPIVDTVKRVEGGRIAATVDRAGLWAAATPQAFRLDVLRRALALKAETTDEAGLCERLGIAVAITPVSRLVFKVTTPEDLELAEAILRSEGRMSRRLGIGFDAHPFSAGRPLFLGGVKVPHDAGLAGHSDGDALLHAIGDAILGAAGLASIGERFPDDDPCLAGVASGRLLEGIRDAARERGFSIENLDAVVIAESPRIAPHREAIRASIAALLEVPVERVNVRGTSSNGLGFAGRGEGIAAVTVVFLTSLDNPAEPVLRV